eukprot:scaffold73695_cov28-Tisochrysis_lutea.AAC.1
MQLESWGVRRTGARPNRTRPRWAVRDTSNRRKHVLRSPTTSEPIQSHAWNVLTPARDSSFAFQAACACARPPRHAPTRGVARGEE